MLSLSRRSYNMLIANLKIGPDAGPIAPSVPQRAPIEVISRTGYRSEEPQTRKSSTTRVLPFFFIATLPKDSPIVQLPGIELQRAGPKRGPRAAKFSG